MSETQHLLSYQGVDLSLEDNVVLKNIHLKVNPGDYFYLIGKTGSGKSSLLKSMYGDVVISSGKALVAGYDLLHLRERDLPGLRRKLGIVFQDFRLLEDRNVFENLNEVLRATGWIQAKERTIRIEEVLESVQMAPKTNQYLHKLSGGEKQRISIARALLNHPEIILADEPTGNLDPDTTFEVMQLFEQLHQSGQTVLLATHDYRLIETFQHPVLKCENQQVQWATPSNS